MDDKKITDEQRQKLDLSIIALEESLEALSISNIDKNSLEYYVIAFHIVKLIRMMKEFKTFV